MVSLGHRTTSALYPTKLRISSSSLPHDNKTVARHDYNMADSSSVPTDYTRLHITPLNQTLLNAILPPSILPNARNISYHTLETFPEKAYGYVELPKMDADNIKKKLNGSILKGTKVRIETAKPKKELVLEPEDPTYPKKEKALKDSKKRKRGQETVPAAQIGDRSVKRGWTTPTAAISKRDKSKDKDGKKAVVKSKYTTGPECLFKTVLPANVAANVNIKEAREGKPDKKRRKSDKETVVHEFSKTTKYATFLRGAAGSKKTKVAAEFVEGKGWVDEDGNVVEEAVGKEKKRQLAPKVMEEIRHQDSTSEDESPEVSSSSEEESDTEEMDTTPQMTQTLKEDSPTSSSGSSSQEDSESEASSSEDESDAESSGQEVKTPKKNILPPISTSRPQSSSGPPSGLSIQIPDLGITSTPIAGEVHPLEALYKRPHPGLLNPLPKPAASSFSFFGADGDDGLEEEESHDQVPLTPFTQKDFEFRGIRSAAPTPDTAHANKRFIWPTDNEEEDEDEEPSSPIRKESPAKTTDANTGEPESDFQKWFYENRGETNRAWKKRRKAAGKEKRQRENRKRNDRAF